MKRATGRKTRRPSAWLRILIGAATSAVIALIVLSSIRNQREIKKMAVEEFNQQQLILARSAAKGVEIYLKSIITELSALSDASKIAPISSERARWFEQAYLGFPQRSSIRLLDNSGVLRYIYPCTGWRKELIGKDYSREPYFQEAKETGHIALSPVLYNERGEPRIRIAAPFFSADGVDAITNRNKHPEFMNVLVASLDPVTLSDDLISPVKSGKTGYAWVLDSKGVFLSHYISDFVGRDAFGIRRTRNPLLSYEAIEEIQRRMMMGTEGKGRYVSGWHRAQDGEIEKLVAYAPIHLPGKTWSVAVCAPMSEVSEILNRSQHSQWYLLAVVIAVLLLAGAFFFVTDFRWSHALEREVGRRTRDLQESQERYRLTLENMRNGIAVYEAIDGGRDFVCRDLNRAAMEMEHVDLQGVIGRSIREIFPGAVEFGIFDALRRVWATGKPEHLPAKEYRDERIHGWRENFIYKLPSGEIVAVYTDETERKKAGIELQANEKKLRAILNASPVGINLVINRRIVWLNRAMPSMMGYDEKAALLGKSVEAFYLNPEEYQRVGLALYENGDAAGIGSVETRWVRKDGTLLDCYLQTCVVDPSDLSQGHIVVVMDISEQKRYVRQKKELEERLRQVEKMESIGTLAGGIAHDFNNILFPIIGFTELLLLDAAMGSNLRDKLERILDAAERARDLVKQILTFCRQENTGLEPIRIQPVLKEALNLLRASIPATIEIRQTISNECGMVMGNSTRIHQIIMNLCTNAYHAMEEKGGIIQVSLSELFLSDETRGLMEMKPARCVELKVSDTGCGMAPELLKKIFEPYFTTKDVGRGNGMGLSVVYGIVKEFGGEIRVESEIGKGSAFRIYLPVIQDAGDLESRNSSRDVLPAGMERILLVDDDEDAISVQKEMLEQLGYAVTENTNSLEALERFRSEPNDFDLVITDLTMPHMTGYALSRELLRIRRDIPVILCTGSHEEVSEEQAELLGIKGFFRKPVRMRRLAGIIRRAVEHSTAKN